MRECIQVGKSGSAGRMVDDGLKVGRLMVDSKSRSVDVDDKLKTLLSVDSDGWKKSKRKSKLN